MHQIQSTTFFFELKRSFRCNYIADQDKHESLISIISLHSLKVTFLLNFLFEKITIFVFVSVYLLECLMYKVLFFSACYLGLLFLLFECVVVYMCYLYGMNVCCEMKCKVFSANCMRVYVLVFTFVVFVNCIHTCIFCCEYHHK